MKGHNCPMLIDSNARMYALIAALLVLEPFALISKPGVVISPGSATVIIEETKQFTAVISPPSAAVTWAVNGLVGGNAEVGTISFTGLYTAPTALPYPGQVKVTVAKVGDPKQSASATVTVSGGVTLSISPSRVDLSASGTQQFKATVNGASNTTVNWSISPAIGAISSVGVYTAPPSIATAQSILVTAASVADPTESASAQVTLNPPISVLVSPGNVSLHPSATQQFSAAVSGTSNTAVSWYLNPTIGTISSTGLYTAPPVVPTIHSISVMATSQADPTKGGVANLTLLATPDTTPPVVSFTAPASGAVVSGQVAITASVSDKVAVDNVSFLLDGIALGLALTAPPYTIAWDTAVTSNGTHTISIVAKDTAGNPASASEPVTVQGGLTNVVLPVEVVGPDGTVRSVTVNVPSPVSGSRLWMQIHNLKYDSEASVQVNDGPWIAINTGNSTLLGLANAYGGIGGGFSTLKLSVAIPDGVLVSGKNTVTFRFNGTDGITSGFRVLAFNVLAPNGTQLVDSSSFLKDDPDQWQAPSLVPADIAAGKVLWQNADLTAPGMGAIKAKCASCHTQDGRDLKYFNYSNNSIQARAVFHGLSEVEGSQIASYIRSLNVPNPGRPWNPPYQPGPGLDSKPVEQWAAGAGLDWVLDRDQDTFTYLAPGGDTSNWAPMGNVSAREIPIALQLPDWNRWLPHIHPMDAWPDFAGSEYAAYYPTLRSVLRSGDPVSYQNAHDWLSLWGVRWSELMVPKILPQYNPPWTANYTDAVYSTALWNGVKLWELMQEFGLEGLNQSIFGPRGDTRGWYSGWPFFISPNMQHIPRGTPGIDNGLLSTHIYVSLIWYQLQMILNNSSRTQSGSSPIDYPYVYGFIKDTSLFSSKPQAALQTLWLIKDLQESETGVGPEAGSGGWQPTANDPSRLVHHDWTWIWDDTPVAARKAIMQAYLQLWFAKVQSFTPQQFYSGGWASASYIPVRNAMDGSFGDRIWYMLPLFRYFGVDTALTDGITDWAKTVWPNANWNALKTATCSTNPDGSSVCSTQF
jgi:hypothetical protein